LERIGLRVRHLETTTWTEEAGEHESSVLQLLLSGLQHKEHPVSLQLQAEDPRVAAVDIPGYTDLSSHGGAM
jgi:hypothetical protein